MTDWTGTEKQVAWAQRIRAEALPIIGEWSAAVGYTASCLRRRRAPAGQLQPLDEARRLLGVGQGITDARFWIDARDCATRDDFIAAVQRWEGRPRANPPHRLAGALAFRGLRPTRQETAHTCGPASLQCVAAFTGRRPAEAAIAKALGTTKRHGTTPAQLRAGAEALSLRPTMHRRMGLVAVLMALKRGRPTIVLWNNGGAHWSVVVGVHAERRSLVLADPLRADGMRLVRFADFKRRWRARVAGRRYIGLGLVCRP